MATPSITGSSAGQVAIFWDYENCSPPSSMSGYELAGRIRDLAHEWGIIKYFKAYAHFSEQISPRSLTFRSELQSSGVTLSDCPNNGRKNVVDQMIIADTLTFAMDNPSCKNSSTVMIISGDRDYAYTLSILRLRMYRVVVVAPQLPGAHISLKAQASSFLDWNFIIGGQRREEKKGVSPSSSMLRPVEVPANLGPLRSKSSNYSVTRTPERRVHQTHSQGYHNSEATPSVPKNMSDSIPFSDNKSSEPFHVFGFSQEPDYDFDGCASLEPSPILMTDMDSQPTVFSPVLNSHFPSFVHSTSSSVECSGPKIVPHKTPKIHSLKQPPVIPDEFQRLVQLLENYRLGGTPRPYRSSVALDLVTQDPQVYEKAGFSRFSFYANQASDLGLVKLGGTGGSAWIALHYSLQGTL